MSRDDELLERMGLRPLHRRLQILAQLAQLAQLSQMQGSWRPEGFGSEPPATAR